MTNELARATGYESFFKMTSTVTCRGVSLLKVSKNTDDSCQDVLVSVHQLSAELWKQFRTPRTSVQKKIENLKISLLHCDREQVYFLRSHHVIEGYRATVITLKDAERLYDSMQRLQEKRRLRGEGSACSHVTPNKKFRDEKKGTAVQNPISSSVQVEGECC